MFTAILKHLKMLRDSKNGSPLLEIDYKGFVYSFMINNDPVWLPVVEQSSKMCYDQLTKSNEGAFCDGWLKCFVFNFFIIFITFSNS